MEVDIPGLPERTRQLLRRGEVVLAESRHLLIDLDSVIDELNGTGSRAPGDAIVVRIVGFPIGVWQRSQQHYDELLREFAHILQTPPHKRSHVVPRRLLEVIDAVTAAYADISAVPAEARQRAANEGVSVIDLEYRLPATMAARVVEDVVGLAHLLDEADEYCGAGTELLTLAAPPEIVEFRRWLLAEFVAQLDGAEPTGWAARSPQRLDLVRTGRRAEAKSRQ